MAAQPPGPLVSALMVFARPERRKLARLSARSFLDQTWPRKELVLFNSTRLPLFFWPRRNVREIRLRHRTPSQMLDICFENANGTWCVLWWDDCLYRHDYLDVLVKSAEPASLVLLQNMVVFDRATNSFLTRETEPMSCPLFARCRPISFGVDLESQFTAVKRVQNDPELVVKVLRVLHG